MKEIDFNELKKLIKDGIRQHDEDKIIGMMLIKEIAGIRSQNDQNELDDKIDMFLDGMSYNIICNLKKYFKQELIITQDGKAINFSD